MGEEDAIDEIGCGRIPLEDFMAFADIQRFPAIDEENLRHLIEKGTYGKS